MPGISFLFKKRFHPSRIDNQKRVFLTEEKKKNHELQERDMAAQVAKEQELQLYEGLGKAPELDPRNASLKFMYHAPEALKVKATHLPPKEEEEETSGRNSKKKIDVLAIEKPVALDERGDDEHVRAFRAKFLPPTSSSTSSGGGASHDTDVNGEEMVFGPALPPRLVNKNSIQTLNSHNYSDSNDEKQDKDEEEEEEEEIAAAKPMHYEQSALEKAIGRRKMLILTAETQQERHPILKNAPVEGVFAQSAAVKHKPFNAVIRNVRCLRCGEWGHYSGERECRLRGQNPLDAERRLREDPMAAHRPLSTNSAGHTVTNHATTSILHHNGQQLRNDNSSSSIAASVRAQQYFHGNNHTGFSSNNNSSSSVNNNNNMLLVGGYESSDPEGDFLRTLTRREKKLLLRKLHQIDNKNNNNLNDKNQKYDSDTSYSTSDSDSSSTSDDSSRISQEKHRKRKEKKGSKKKEHKKKRKHRHHYSDNSEEESVNPKKKRSKKEKQSSKEDSEIVESKIDSGGNINKMD